MIRTLRESPLLQDPRNFLALGWRHLLGLDPTPIQYEVMSWLVGGPNKLMAKGFRGMGKSWIAALYAVFEWAMDQDTKILVVSASAQRAADFSTFVRQLLESWPLVAELRPSPDSLRDSKIRFDVAGACLAQSASMTAMGIGGQLTGARANVILPDDVEIPNNADTPGKRLKNAAYFREFGSVLSPGGRIRVLGTDQTEESLYRSLPEKGYAVRCWPARYPDLDLRLALADSLSPSIARAVDADPSLAGAPTEPTRFPEEVLLDKEADLGRSHFRLQFLLDPRMADASLYPLRLSDLVVHPTDLELAPERLGPGGPVLDLPCVGMTGDHYRGPGFVAERWAPYQGKVLAIDPAGRGRDETAAAVVGALNGFLYLRRVRAWLGAGYSDEVLAELAALAQEERVTSILVEANWGDGMFVSLLRPHLQRLGYQCAIEEVKHNIQKERRILDTLEPPIQQHRLVVDPEVLRYDLEPIRGVPEGSAIQYRLAHQLTRITRDRGSLVHDDRIDVLALAVGYWKEALAQDARRRQQEARDRDMMSEIEAYHRAAVRPLRDRETGKSWVADATGRPTPEKWNPPKKRGRRGQTVVVDSSRGRRA